MRHGFLQSSGSNLYLQYYDGTPFFWLGDTHWSGFSSAEHFYESNDPRFRTMFEGMLQVRRQQGYTVWKAETFANNDEGGNPPTNEGGPAWLNDAFFQDLNVDFWKEIDKRVRLVVSYDFVVSIAVGIGRSLKDPSLEPQHTRLSLYLLARYAAFPVVWITCQEYCADACSDCWARIAAALHVADPYHRPTSMHNCANNPIAWHGQPWYSFVTLQLGHNALTSVDHWLQQYAASPKLPVVEDEANYEQLIQEYGGGALWLTRQAAWQAVVGGAFGYTYGGQGIWWACWNTSYSSFNCGPAHSAEYRVWNETLTFPFGGSQISAFAGLWQSLPWYAMIPDDSLIQWIAAPTGTQRPFQKATANHSHIVAYLPNATATYTGLLVGLNPALSYTLSWFDPRSGSVALIRSSVSGPQPVPRQPSQDDWVLLVLPTGAQPIPPASALVTGVDAGGTPRSDSTSFVGMALTVAQRALRVTHLGRFFVAGNSQKHVLRLVQKSFLAVLAEVEVDMAEGEPDALGFKYAAVPNPPVLNAGGEYYLVSAETAGGDVFLDNIKTVVNSTRDALIISAVYANGDVWEQTGGPGSAYGPVSLRFEASPDGERD